MKYNDITKTRSIALLIWAFSLIFASTVSALPSSHKNTVKNSGKENYLFVQSASKVKIEVVKGHTHLYKVTLKNVSPYVTYFADRPYRNTNTMSTEKFVELWHKQKGDSFLQNPPNADLVATQIGFYSDHKLINFVVELTDPHYDAKSKTLTYIAKPLKGSEVPTINSLTLHHVYLFIDDVCLSCWGN